jgi:NDP-sugar pyrophosphorylase family protein/mannose-6-phosphate isomerase-like protein (cupin superfamily)
MSVKTIYKPWGREEWLELNDKYCYKRIYINAGTKTSYQYHEMKLETNYLIEGTAEFWLENDEGVVEKTIEEAGYFVTVKPFRKHRVVAITDIILQEVSTPEVNDVIRIDDDSNREDGKIEHEHKKPALCILAAGLGSRLENLSEHINKGLLPLDNKAIISHIIEKVSIDYDIIVVLGYRGDMVREYCESAHSDRNFTFVNVDKYEGKGTGPGYSIKQAKEHLQRPFIWVTADTIITDDLPKLDSNWLGVYPTSIPELYATAQVENGEVINFKNKNKNGYDNAFIGLAGVYDYETFWNQLDIQKNSEWVDRKGIIHSEGSEIVSAYHDVSSYSQMKAKQFDWYDVGTIDNYIKAKNLFKDSKVYSIPKVNGEFLYKVGNKFIKLSSDKTFIKNRIDRAINLKTLTPTINYKGKNLYSYDWIEGEVLYDYADLRVWELFLDFANKHLWEERFMSGFDEICLKFYKDKTMDRLNKFLSSRDESFLGSHTVNGTKVESIENLLKVFDWDRVCDGIPTEVFHGDFHFDHVVYDGRENFHLLDWRQNFGGGDVGDVYYDLAKMYGGILMSYKFMKDEDNFSCFIDDNIVSYYHLTDVKLEDFRPIYERWVVKSGYDLDKVKLITALIFLNMSPLHETEFGNLVFFKSKQMLQEIT